MKHKVISYKSLPSHIPVVSFVVWCLLMDRLSLPAWVWASVGTVWGLILIGSTVLVFTQETVDLFPDQKKEDQ